MTTSLQNNKLTLPLIANKPLAIDVQKETEEQSPSGEHVCLDLQLLVASVALPIFLRTQFTMALSHQTGAAWYQIPCAGVVEPHPRYGRLLSVTSARFVAGLSTMKPRMFSLMFSNFTAG